MAKKNILNEASEEVKEKPVKKSTRLRNADVVSLLEGLQLAIEKERNLRLVRENVIERENALQLDGLVTKLKAMALSFKLFTAPPRAQ
jgi:hypothetical protein